MSVGRAFWLVGGHAGCLAAPCGEYAGKVMRQVHLRRSRACRRISDAMKERASASGGCRKLETTRITNSPAELRRVIARAGKHPRVVLEATYGWYWAADTLAAAGAK